MPIVSTYFGIIIRINYDDHNPPHFHAEYQGFKGVFDIKNGQMLAGNLPLKVQKIIREWGRSHRLELVENWFLAINRKPLKRIPGADQ